MKTLLAMRHAKSDRSDPSLHDHDRPLADRGRADTPRIADWMRHQGLSPAYVSCSSARRTQDTLELLEPALGDAKISIVQDLYLATADELLDHVRKLPNDADPVLLIGHNPGLHQLVLHLVGRSPERRRIEARFPTAAVAVLAVPVADWSETRPGTAELTATVTPGALR